MRQLPLLNRLLHRTKRVFRSNKKVSTPTTSPFDALGGSSQREIGQLSGHNHDSLPAANSPLETVPAHVESRLPTHPAEPLYLFGTPSNVEAKRPPPNPGWDSSERASTFNEPPKNAMLNPPTTIPDTGGFSYPRAPVYKLNTDPDPTFQRGYRFACDYFPTEAASKRKGLLSIRTPPNISPQLVDGKWVHQPVPNMMQMEPGIPYVNYINGDPARPVTVGCLHTMGSLAEYSDFGEIHALVDELRLWTWGRLAAGDKAEILPIYKHEGLKRNDRSARPGSNSRDGSYNIASVNSKGIGQGVFMPAVQAATSLAQTSFRKVNILLHKLACRIIPKCVHKEEFDVTQFNSLDNNIFSLGGLEPGPNACQMNISSSFHGGVLTQVIGLIQGSWHSDNSDDPTRWTFLVMLFRLPEGSDPGAFCLGRAGLYVRELNVYVVFLVFKGNDLHSGFSPSMTEAQRTEWLQTLESMGEQVGPENRVVYVCYPNRPACTREAQLSITRPLTFGNHGAPVAHKMKNLNFADHGRHILGNARAFYNRMAREGVYMYWNFCQHVGLIADDPFDMLEGMTYEDEDGLTCQCERPQYHPVRDADKIADLRSRFEWHRLNMATHRIIIHKKQLKKMQLALTATNILNDTSAPTRPLLRAAGNLQITTEKPLSNPSPNVPHISGIRLGCVGRHRDDTAYVPPKLIPAKRKRSTYEGLTYEEIDDIEFSVAEPAERDVGDLDDMMDDVGLAEDDEVDLDGREEAGGEMGDQTEVDMLMEGGTEQQGDGEEGEDEVMDVDEDVEMCGGTGNVWHSDEETLDLDDGSDESEVSGLEFEVEAVCDSKVEFDQELFRVRWVDFGPEHDSWLPRDALGSAKHALQAFERTQRATTRAVNEHNSQPRQLCRPTGRKTSQKTVDSHGYHPTSKKLPTQTTKPITMSSCGQNILANLLSEETLRTDLADIKAMMFSIKTRHPVDHWAVMTAKTAIDEQIAALPPGPWTDQSASLAVAQLVHAVELLPVLHKESAACELLKRGMNWEASRSHIQVYDWYVTKGPTLARVLFQCHQQGNGSLQLHYPQFSKLVDHIFQYVQALVAKKQSAAPPNTSLNTSHKPPRKKAKAAHETTASVTLAELEKVPADLYGLHPTSSKAKIQLAPIKMKNLSGVSGRQYDHAIDIFLSLISDAIIVPSMKSYDNALNGKGRSKDDSDLIRMRCLVRGAILYSFVPFFKDGDDGLFASSNLDTVLRSPYLLFNSPIAKDGDLAARLLVDPKGAMDCVRECISKTLSATPGCIPIARDIGDHVFDAVQTLFGQRTISRTSPKQAPFQRQSRSRRLPVSTVAPEGRISFETLIQTADNAPHFDQVALMIRETLNVRRGHKTGDEYLSRILSGLSPATGSVGLSNQKDLDHFMPVRWDNFYAQLLFKHLPPHQLVTRLGISNLLLWMATGQGLLTRNFIEAFFVFFQTLDEAVSAFERAKEQGVMFENSRVWGQAAKALSFKAVKGMTIRDKLAPFFDEKVQDNWITTLGALANHPDPKSYTGPCPSYTDAKEFVKGFMGFGDGLTQIQFANNLVHSSIIEVPSIGEMTPWIAQHPRLGAFGGLKALGFNVVSGRNGIPWVHAAFQCVYDYFNLHLSIEDKAELQFGVIFVEHILCKVCRWQGTFVQANTTVDLASLGLAARQAEIPWVRGANLNDHTGKLFPLPLTAAQSELEKSIAHSLL